MHVNTLILIRSHMEIHPPWLWHLTFSGARKGEKLVSVNCFLSFCLIFTKRWSQYGSTSEIPRVDFLHLPPMGVVWWEVVDSNRTTSLCVDFMDSCFTFALSPLCFCLHAGESRLSLQGIMWCDWWIFPSHICCKKTLDLQPLGCCSRESNSGDRGRYWSSIEWYYCLCFLRATSNADNSNISYHFQDDISRSDAYC